MDHILAWVFAHGGNIGFASLVTLAIVLIMTGRLVPRSNVDSLRADWNDRLDAKEQQVQDWRSAYQKALDAQAVRDAQLGELLEHSRTTAYFIQALATQAKPEKA
jgi:hypothetical protein